jgi:phytanoyl-CoA hydroxylase
MECTSRVHIRGLTLCVTLAVASLWPLAVSEQGRVFNVFGFSKRSISPLINLNVAPSSMNTDISAGKLPGAKCGRISETEYILTPEQIESFHRDGCITLPNVLRQEEVDKLEIVFDKFLSREIPVPGKDFCDMSKPFNTPFEDWSIVNCMLPTKYHPPWQNNIYEQVTSSIAQQLFPERHMVKDYDQLLNKRPGKSDAVFAWHQDMGYWPTPKALDGVTDTSTVTFSLAVDDSTEANGCLRYVAGSGETKELRPHVPVGTSRDDAHAITIKLADDEEVSMAPCPRGSVTIHDEFVIHGSGGNTCPDRQRRTYVLAYRSKEIVDAERDIGFTHSHNDAVNWDTFNDDASHRVGKKQDNDKTK